MNSIIIDCSDGMSLYVLKEDEVYSSISKTQKKHTDELLLALDELLKKASILIGDVNNICVCTGPGSFTGIRVAVSVCKGLAIGTGAKVFECSNFDAMCFGDKEKAYYLCDAFSDFVYVRTFNGKTYKDECLHFDEFAKKFLSDYKIYVSSEKLQNQLNNAEIPCKIAESKLILLFKDKLLKNENLQINEIEPIYLRASQAEIEREKKLKGENNGRL